MYVLLLLFVFFFKQKTAYEMRIRDWSSDVCSSDLESDRMGHLLGAIDQKTLDEQRGVVQNEKRQGENQPYGQLRQVVAKTMYPVGHPYHHTTIGSMNDLNAAKLEDVKQWFRTWYGPNNAVLVLEIGRAHV